MNSLISLSAVGLLYIHLTARRSLAHLLLLVAAIIPIAIATNIVRVLILVLITYHLGDAAGQGFLHEFAGFVMFLIALAGLALLDLILGRFLPGPQPPTLLEARNVDA
jgi:exosortase/archaeosortase family protein